MFTSGQLPKKDGQLMTPGGAVSEEAAHAAARQCRLNALVAITKQVGALSAIKRVVKVIVFMASEPGFTAQPKIANGASRAPWRSVRRGRVVHHVLGCHIEMTATPGVDYPVLTTYQPDEPPLQLPLSILRDVRAALDEIGEEPHTHCPGGRLDEPSQKDLHAECLSPMRPRRTGSLAEAGNLVPYAHHVRNEDDLGSESPLSARCRPFEVHPVGRQRSW